MTVNRPPETGLAKRLDAAQTGSIAPADALDLLTASVVSDSSVDAIALSARALALIRAGLAVRALVIYALLDSYRSVIAGGRSLVLECGVYRAAWN